MLEVQKKAIDPALVVQKTATDLVRVFQQKASDLVRVVLLAVVVLPVVSLQ